jgi:aminopeptidase N/puromycin-sensitive aminopeptidase
MHHLSRFTLSGLALAATAVLFGLAPSAARAQRLSTTVRPTNYTITLAPDLKSATFSGVERIDVNIARPVQSITLNAAEIAFQSVTILPNGAEQTATVSLDAGKQQATFTFPKIVPAGNATLSIRYTGILNNELRGFYLSKTDRRDYAVTQFESTDARRAFPCFDEPAFKATFDISLVVDTGDAAISNSPIATVSPGPGPGKSTVAFARTPRMSTYLVAFLVGDFACTGGTSDGVSIRVCATPDKVPLTSYGLEVAKYVLHYYNNYFGIPFPMKKLDLVGLPDFEAGAMENFGAITFRETDLLLDPKTASVDMKKEVALVIAHEMAHQWFGDLVTMQWWDNIWLNEGFATWMENKPIEAMHPEWHIDQTVASDEQGTLNTDAQPTTRAIRAKADTPDEINQMFDSIAYGKASDVLLSVENYLGEETFRQGVHAYLAAHEYANATAEDFWNAQTATSHKPVNKIMDSLVAQPGVPLLTFGAPAGGRVSVTQSRFFLSPSVENKGGEKWTLPVCFKSGADGQRCEVLTPETTSLAIPPASLFDANAGGKGYYRSTYAPASYKALVAAAETSLSPAERISLIGDEWAQVRAEKATVGDYLDLVSALKADPNAVVIDDALGGVATIFDDIASTPEETAAMARWVRTTFSPEYAKLGVPSATDTPNTRELRARLLGLLGQRGNDPEVARQARQIADAYLADPSSVDPTLAFAALPVAVRDGDAALFDRLQKVYETSTNPELQEGALRLLAEFTNPALAQRALEYAISGKVRNQDAAIQFAIALQIPENRDLAWQFIKANWEKVQALLTTSLGATLVESTRSFCTAAARDGVRDFFAAHPVPASDVSLRHAIEQINGCIELRRLQEPNLNAWLASGHTGI